MEKKVVNENKNIKYVLVSFSSEETKKAEKLLVNEFNKSHTIEGFRKGKVPLQVIKMKMGEDFENWLKDYMRDKSIEELNKEYKVLFEPNEESFAIDQGKVEIEYQIHTYPEIIKTKFEEMNVEVPEVKEILEKFIESKVEEVLSNNATLTPKEEPAEFNDHVRLIYDVVNSEGKIIQEKKELEHTLYEDDKRELVQNVVGKKSGETFEYTKETEDNSFTYKVKIDQVYNKEMPELTDDLIKDSDLEQNTIEELKEKFRNEGKEMFEKWNNDYIKNYIIGELPDYVEAEISEETIEKYTQIVISNLKENNKYEEELKKQDNDEDKLYATLKKESEKYIKELAIVDKISKEHDIKPENEDIDSAIEDISKMYQMPFERIKESIYSNQKLLNEIVWDVLKTKVVDKIKEKVSVKEINKEEFDKKNKENKE